MVRLLFAPPGKELNAGKDIVQHNRSHASDKGSPPGASGQVTDYTGNQGYQVKRIDKKSIGRLQGKYL